MKRGAATRRLWPAHEPRLVVARRHGDQRVGPGVGVGGHPLGQRVRRRGDRAQVDELVGEDVGGGSPVAGQKGVLAGPGLLAEAVLRGQVDVEVLVLRAHGPEVEGQPGPDGLAGGAHVGGDGHRHDRRHVDVPARAARAREALVEPVEQHRRAGRVEQEGQPAVGDLARLDDGSRADGPEVDRDGVLDRLGQELQRPAEAGPALDGQLHRLAGQDAAHRVHVLARARGRADERDAVPALRDLRPAQPEAEAEAPAAEHVERRRGHGRAGRRAGRDLHEARAEGDPLRLRGQPAEHRDGVLAPGLGDPHGVEPELVAQAGQPALLLRGEPGPVGEEQAEPHPRDVTGARGGRRRTA
jgi:hypothetical protein